ncbi:hypothetical protein PHET_00407 [Paragonimus heterotremus]|uniref:PDZ domain-containing protein n=1 Tax=Paragonimus heterotremus TaxID=100268 RepID=A0A8J4X3L5_9TREM|nr:hypothetical protein PHET_00407 [Paragonimus heterotremus]
MTYVEKSLLLRNGPPWGFRLYEDFMEGLIVSKIRRRSPAEFAGLKEGDHVLAINGLDALDMSHARAVQIIDYASYTLEIIVARYERLQKVETIYLDNRSLQSRQKPQELTTTELQLFWEKGMPLKPARRPEPPPKPTVVFQTPSPPPPPPPVRVPQVIRSVPPPPKPRPQPMIIHMPPPPRTPPPPPPQPPSSVREPTPEDERKIIPNDPDVSSVSVKQLMREFDVPAIAPDLRKKNYADSSFYSDPARYYPTIEEQIEMARKVAESLHAPENSFSKGVNMFEKQRIRADKHVREGPEPEPDPIEMATPDELENMVPPSPPPPPPPPPPSFPGLQPVNKPAQSIPPPPVLMPGQPKTVQEFLEKIKVFPTSRHSDMDPQKCFDIASALYTSDSRGAKMFAKRHSRAKKWAAEGNEEAEHSAQPTMADGPGPTKHDAMKLKLLSKLPQQPTSSMPKPQFAQTKADFGKKDSEGIDMSRKPRVSLVDERSSTTPEPSSSIDEGTPKPFGHDSAFNPFPTPAAFGSHLTGDSDVGTSLDADSSQSGWRPVKFKMAQTAT